MNDGGVTSCDQSDNEVLIPLPPVKCTVVNVNR